MSLVSDVAAAEPADVTQVILQLRSALVAVIEEGARNRVKDDGANDYVGASQYASKLVKDLDAGELLWPGWKKGRA